VLVSECGGGGGRAAPGDERDDDRPVLGVNLRGVGLAPAALPALERSDAAAIVTVASVSGLGGEPYMSIYSASKGGVIKPDALGGVELGARDPGELRLPGTTHHRHDAAGLRGRAERGQRAARCR